jgi:hypothetical protein
MSEPTPELLAWARELYQMLVEDHPEIDAFSVTQGQWTLHVTKTSARVAGPGGLRDLTAALSPSRTSDSLRGDDE